MLILVAPDLSAAPATQTSHLWVLERAGWGLDGGQVGEEKYLNHWAAFGLHWSHYPPVWWREAAGDI